MKQLADGIFQLGITPRSGINAYLIDDILFDACSRHDTRSILRDLKGRTLAAHALTHAHPDHQGASHAVCEQFGVPFWVGEADVAAAENPELIGERQPDTFLAQFFVKTLTGPGHPVDRVLREGDEVGSFKVIDVPGHSAGHVAFWRESDGVLVLGDVLTNMDVLTTIPGLHEPKAALTPDPAENRRSIKKLAPLEPKLVLFGHGPPSRDTKKFTDFIAGLPD